MKLIYLILCFLFCTPEVNAQTSKGALINLDSETSKTLEALLKKVTTPSKEENYCNIDLTPLNLLNYNRVNALTMFVVFPKMNSYAAKESSLTGSMNTSNIWTPTIYVVPKKFADSDVYFVCPPDQCPMLDDLNEQSLIQFHNMTEEEFSKNAKVFHADGIVRQYKLKYEKPLRKLQSISMEVGITQRYILARRLLIWD